jgi:hypothetical protein
MSSIIPPRNSSGDASPDFGKGQYQYSNKVNENKREI